ncbi:MAG: outer membrane beta-barrel protein [Acidobacteria bacterium]|nr:outer membrane beta-barrel protein [Acidobacteriota bacterium]
MRNDFARTIFIPLFIASAWAQGRVAEPRYEFGAGVTGSFYDKKTFTATGGNADAGFDKGFGASVWLGHYMYPKISGELRYDYLRNDMTLSGSGAKASFGGESHAVHYDVHFHFADSRSKVRPYLLAGGGVKMFRGTGEERAFQPLSQIAVLTHTTELTGLISVGAGIKMQLSDRVNLRLEFRDNLSKFPKKVIAPNRGSGGDGWVNNFTPTVGLGVLF